MHHHRCCVALSLFSATIAIVFQVTLVHKTQAARHEWLTAKPGARYRRGRALRRLSDHESIAFMESAGSVDTTSHRSQSHTEPIPAELPRKTSFPQPSDMIRSPRENPFAAASCHKTYSREVQSTGRIE